MATVEGAELHYICITKTCHEFEVGEALLSLVTTTPTAQSKPRDLLMPF
jgi:hypothetical protein